MKKPNNVKGIDANSRITVPADCRRRIGVCVRDFVEIFTDDDRIILKKYGRISKCAFCNSQRELWTYRNQSVCDTCCEGIENLREEQKLIPLKDRTYHFASTHKKQKQ